MKIRYINILLFAHPLNILEHNQRNHKSTTPCHTQTNRSLCECELYAPANYDNDPEMKKVMQQFEDRTSHRFQDYDERMKTTRQKCKDRCDKESQKIILKDKLEKELMDKFATLQTDIQNDAIPSCVCEKSMADKMEKGCLRCAQNLGGIVAPSTGVLGEIAAFAVKAWKTTEIAAATQAAIDKGLALGKIAGEAQGMEVVIRSLKTLHVHELFSEIFNPFVTTKRYTEVTTITEAIITKHELNCSISGAGNKTMCTQFDTILGVIDSNGNLRGAPARSSLPKMINYILEQAEFAADTKAAQVAAAKTPALKAAKVGAVEAATTPYYTPIIVSIVAIVVIILIMVIIYLILRYRRKKKMKKKLQYIKLLEE